MSVPASASIASRSLSGRYSTGNTKLDGYLDRMVDPLFGRVPEEQCERLWLESADHLEHLIERYCREGLTLDSATERATELYGAPEDAANEFLHQWVDRHGTQGLTRRFGRANLFAFSWFALAQVFYVILLQIRIFMPARAALHIPFSPAEVRAVWPEPLPFPDFSLEFAVTVLYPILVPFVAGWVCGLKIPSRAPVAVYHALTPLIFYSFVMGALLLPKTEGLLYALFQIAFWLPVGCLTAYLSSLRTRKLRLRAARATELSRRYPLEEK